MIEIIAVITSLLSVWLTIKNKIICWPIGIVGIITYMQVFYSNQLYANMNLQIIFLIQSIYGWIFWNRSESLIYRSTIREHIFSIISLIVSFLVIYHFHDNFLDSITTSISISATILLILHRLENWIYWIIADIFYLFLFIGTHNYYSLVLYIIFAIISIKGYIQWRKNTITD
jgi:nicotinamide mononucleotide transporter